MDYTGTYNYCDYYSTYGTASYGDYPYMLDQAITTDQLLVTSAINSKGLGSGADYPEDYARILYETTADPSIEWRSGARRFVVAWLDAPPHDCALGYGVDPGRDEVAGTDDDLTMPAVLAAMAEQNITLIVLYSGESEYFDDWQSYALATGGVAYQIYYDGSIPGGIDIADYITGIIQEETGTIDELTLEVCTEGYEDWLANLNPASFVSVDLATPFTGGFDVTFTVPEGTEGGIHEFDVCLIGDGAVYARQHVIITVPSGGTTLQVPVDILPRVCPNLVSRSKALPLAILGFKALMF